jgi:hypothetical protein
MSAADAGGVSVLGALGVVALFGGFDAPVDLLPGLVVVGAESWLVEVVIGLVRRGVPMASELGVSVREVQRHTYTSTRTT